MSEAHHTLESLLIKACIASLHDDLFKVCQGEVLSSLWLLFVWRGLEVDASCLTLARHLQLG